MRCNFPDNFLEPHFVPPYPISLSLTRSEIRLYLLLLSSWVSVLLHSLQLCNSNHTLSLPLPANFCNLKLKGKSFVSGSSRNVQNATSCCKDYNVSIQFLISWYYYCPRCYFLSWSYIFSVISSLMFKLIWPWRTKLWFSVSSDCFLPRKPKLWKLKKKLKIIKKINIMFLVFCSVQG